MSTARPSGTSCARAISARRAHAPPSAARGVHHIALLARDVEATIAFYQGVLEFPLTELFENRDYQGSTHFFFDIGNGNLLAFFDFPGLDLGTYAEVLGGLHHIAISVEPERWEHLQDEARRRRRCLPGDERVVAVLQRPRRRAARADLRPARRDVRHHGVDRNVRAWQVEPHCAALGRLVPPYDESRRPRRPSCRTSNSPTTCPASSGS